MIRPPNTRVGYGFHRNTIKFTAPQAGTRGEAPATGLAEAP